MGNRRVEKIKQQVTISLRGGSKSVNGIPAAVVESEFQRIYKRSGELHEEEILQEARPDAAPLHRAFEWDDGKAGELYRLNQARTLVRCVEISVAPNEPSQKGWVSVPKSSETRASAYHPVDVVINRPDLYVMAMQALTAKMNGAIAAVQELQRAAESSDNPDADRLTRIAIAVQAMQTAASAVHALH